MEKEGGINILKKLIESTSNNEAIKSLAQLVLLQFIKFKNDGDLNGLEDSEETDLDSVRKQLVRTSMDDVPKS